MKKYITIAALLAASTATYAGTLTTETTTISSGDYAGTYSGGIVKLTPGAQFHSAIFNILESESEGVLTWGGDVAGTATNISFAGETSNQAFWARFASNQNFSYGHTLYIAAADAATTINTDFTPFTIGGLIVEAGADITLGRGNTLFEIYGTSDSGFLGNIHANTTLLGNNGINVYSDSVWNIASGKTVTLSSTAGVSLLNGSTMTVSGGGNLVVGKYAFSGEKEYTFTGGLSWSNLDDASQAQISATGNSSFTVNGFGVASGFTGTVTLKNIDGTSGANNHKELNLANYGTTGSKIILENMGGVNLWLTGNDVRADIELGSGGLTLSNGSGGSTTTFTGKITGEGNFTHNTAVAQNYKFTGDLSEFKGNFIRSEGGTHVNNQTPGALIFGNGGEGITNGSVSGTGEISWGTGDYADNKFRIFYNYSNDVYASNTIVKGALVKQGAGTLTLKGENSYDGGTTVSAGTLIAGTTTALGTGAVSVESGANLGLIADVTVTGVSSITLADGAMFLIDLTKYAAATESFSLDLVTGAAITLGSVSAASESDEIAGSWFQLKGWEKDGWTSALSYDNSGKTLSLTMTVPEPSAFGMLAGLGALALVASRRRRSR